MKFAHVELKTNDGEHEDGKEEQQTDLQQRYHSLHDGFKHNLQAWKKEYKHFYIVEGFSNFCFFCSIKLDSKSILTDGIMGTKGITKTENDYTSNILHQYHKINPLLYSSLLKSCDSFN